MEWKQIKFGKFCGRLFLGKFLYFFDIMPRFGKLGDGTPKNTEIHAQCPP